MPSSTAISSNKDSPRGNFQPASAPKFPPLPNLGQQNLAQTAVTDQLEEKPQQVSEKREVMTTKSPSNEKRSDRQLSKERRRSRSRSERKSRVIDADNKYKSSRESRRRRSRSSDRKQRRRRRSSSSRQHRHRSRRDRRQRSRRDRSDRQGQFSNSRHQRKRRYSSESYSSSSASSDSYYSRKKRRTRQRRRRSASSDSQTSSETHPYFREHPYLKKDANANGEKPFWDGYQWVRRQVTTFQAQAPVVKKLTEEEQKIQDLKLKNAKKVVIENLPLDLDITAKELQLFFMEKLQELGVEGVIITDVDLKFALNSVALEVFDSAMVDKVKKLDGLEILGEKIIVRRINEETANISAQASAIALATLKQLTSGRKDEAEGDMNVSSKMHSLKTGAPSRILKISNIFDREAELTPLLYEELLEDMEVELQKIPLLNRVSVVRSGQQRLGAEVGSVFAEYGEVKSAQVALELLKGRVYDGYEMKVRFINEQLYFSQLRVE